MALSPLSQLGMIRVPANPKQRNFAAGGVPTKRNKLDGINERHAENGKTLHPTKGFRRISAKRSVAQLILSEIKDGHPYSTAKIAAALRTA